MYRASAPAAEDQLPSVSVIIVNWNGLKFLETCLRSLQLLDYPSSRLEIIVVDNNSGDSSVKYIQDNYPKIKLSLLDDNYGFCAPNNDGALIATGDYLVFLNNDTEVSTGWLRALVTPVMKDPEVICCASKMLYYDRRDTINTAGGKITIVGGGFYRGYGAKDGPFYNQSCYVGFGCAAGVLVKKDFFLSIGGFDEDHFAACEEHDLGWKVWLYGHKVAYTPEAVMYHRESGTFGTRSNANADKVFLNTRNRLFNIIKNLDGGNVVRAMLISFCFNIYRWAGYIFRGNFAAAGAVFRAHFSFLKYLGRMLEKRKIVQNTRKRSDAELYDLGVIATFKESMEEEKLLRLLAKDSYYKA